MPSGMRASISVQRLPRVPAALEQVHREFLDFILPYGSGNVHPGFMGWVQGGGT